MNPDWCGQVVPTRACGARSIWKTKMELSMPLHEVDIFGLLLSPIFVILLLAIVGTAAIAGVINRVISYSLHRNESLLYVLVLVGLAAAMVGHSF